MLKTKKWIRNVTFLCQNHQANEGDSYRNNEDPINYWLKCKTLPTVNYSTVCSPIKAKFRSRAFTYGNIRVLTSSYYYSFVWRFQKCMNCSCSSKDTKVIRFLIFRKIWFLNFAILKSSSNSEMDILIKKFLN